PSQQASYIGTIWNIITYQEEAFFLNFGLYATLILYIIIVIILFCGKVYKKHYSNLATMFLLSLLAPLSWYILAKPHSFVHPWIANMLCALPAVLYLYILIGLMVRNTGKVIIEKFKRLR